jgi:hypothetical protein
LSKDAASSASRAVASSYRRAMERIAIVLPQLLVGSRRWVIQKRSVAWFAECVDALLKMREQ